MADERGCGKLSRDSKDSIKAVSYENGIVVDDADFSDPEEFVDKISDDGLLHMLMGSIESRIESAELS